MASKPTCIIIISFLILTSISTISAASRRGLSQDAAQDCVELSELMIDCLDFVMMPREMIEPLPSCCSSVSKVIQINPICICSSMEEAINMGLILNITAALELPTVCSIEVPPKARCSLLPPSPSPSPSSGMVFLGFRQSISILQLIYRFRK